MKEYTEDELSKLRKSASLMRKRSRSKVAKKAHIKRKQIIRSIKLEDTFDYKNIMRSSYNIKNRDRAHLFTYFDVISNENKGMLSNNIMDSMDTPIQMMDILDINNLKELIDTDNIEQPTHISISNIYPELAFIQADKELHTDRDSFLRKVIGGHPLRREIMFIEYILRNPNSALRCNEYSVPAVYDNIPLYLSISILIRLEIILRYIYYTGESINPNDIFLELGTLITRNGYTMNQTIRSTIYKALMNKHGKHTADFLSKIFQFKKGVVINDNIKTYTLYNKFMDLIGTIITNTPYGYQLIADLCVTFFKNVYITPDILFAINHDTSKNMFTCLKDFVKSPDKICVGSWYSFLEKILLILSKGTHINGSCYGVYSKLIRSTPNKGSVLLHLLNDIRMEIVSINMEANNKRSQIDSHIINQGINRKLILKGAREAIIDGIYTDSMLSMTSKARNKEANALKKVVHNKIKERKLNNFINKREDSI